MDVREAARRTLGARSARVSMRWVLDPPAPNKLIAAMQQELEGVGDLTLRRARLRTLDNPAIDALVERMEAKWPWLDDDEEDDSDAEEPVEYASVFIGARRYLGRGDRWLLAE